MQKSNTRSPPYAEDALMRDCPMLDGPSRRDGVTAALRPRFLAGLACALLGTPQVLLLDEPSVGVDPVSRQDLWDMVAALTGQGLAVIWATAYLDKAERCESVLLLNEGELRFAGPPGRQSRQSQTGAPRGFCSGAHPGTESLSPRILSTPYRFRDPFKG